MKLSRCGICSRSEGTGVVPSRKGSRLKCVLSKMIVTTWLTFPRGELSRQPPAAAGTAATFAAARVTDEAPAAGDAPRSTAVAIARALRCHGADARALPEPFLFSCSESHGNFIFILLMCN